MQKKIENRIRVNVIIIYMLFIVVCGILLFYLYMFRNDINLQKENINQYYSELHSTNELIRTINQAQIDANLFVTTKNYYHLNDFRNSLEEIDHMIDTLIKINEEPDNDIIIILQEINTTLKEKEIIISELNRQFKIQNPFIPINERLQNYEEPALNDTILITTIVKDTIINKVERKNFWKRLANVFSSKNNDSIIRISTLKTDTLQVTYSDSANIIAEMSDFAKKAGDEYMLHINKIEKQVGNLIIIDQEVSSKISDLLIDLYSHIIYSRIEEIENNESELRLYNTYSIIGIITSTIIILIFIIIIIRNVNKGYELRKSLEEANIKTNEIMTSRHKLLLSVSHDIKTPLNSILGYLELSQKNKELSSKDINSMKNSGKHILSLLENLLEFSSLQQGSLKAVYNNFYLNELCLEITEMLSPLAYKKDLYFKYNPDFNSKTCIYSDPLKIKQILINILSNSIKYTIKGGIEFNIKQQNNYFYFTITDTGTGIPENEIQNIYEAFFRVDKNNNIADGSGLGMYVVKGLVDILNGQINIKSEVNKATQVEIIIPVEIISEQKTISPQRILIIDDDISFLSMLKDMFLQLGYESTTCNTLSEIENAYKNINNYDLVITDMEMESISGTEILKNIKKIKIEIPVIIMTARSDFDLNVAKELGFDSYLSKPININSIKQILGESNNSDFNLNILNEMFENDTEYIYEILKTFISATKDNIKSLNELLNNNDFLKVQAICHKMLPMFMQIGAEEISEILKKIDCYRNKKDISYPEWQSDIRNIIPKIELLIRDIQKRINF